MAANKRKQDEKHLKLLREMVALPHNKQCYDCHQRGPTYVNMTIGSFVCTSCSGLLRGLNPPHRVKSISMSSFTPDEMDFLRSRGNNFCKKVWLGLYDSRTNTEPDSKDEQKIRDYMSQKYEKKRWYVQPTETMHEEARIDNTPVRKETTKQIRTLGNNIIPNLLVSKSQPAVNAVSAPSTQSATQRPVPSNHAQPAPVAAPVPTGQQHHHQQQQQPKPAAGMDLLSDLGGDPFAPAAPAPVQTSNPASQTTTPSGGGFADFSAFGSSSGVGGGAPPPQPTFPPAGALMTPVGSSQSSSTAPPSSGFASFPPSTGSSSATTTPCGDKYAALADLDTVLGGGSSSTQSVKWDGSASTAGMFSAGGGSGGGGGAPPGGPQQGWGATPSSQPASAFGGGAPPGGAYSSSSDTSVWRSSGDPFQATSPGDPFQAAPFPGNKASTNPFRQSPAGGNPFGSSQPTSVPGANPFGQTSAAPTSSFGAFGTPPSNNPVQANNGFAAFGQVSTASAQPPPQAANHHQGGFAPVQNGGFGGAQAQQGWGQPPPAAPVSQAGFGGAGGFGAQPGMFGKAAPPPAQAGGFPPQPQPQQQQFGGWPSQPAGNPFMNAATHQSVPPRSGSTNPFL